MKIWQINKNGFQKNPKPQNSILLKILKKSIQKYQKLKRSIEIQSKKYNVKL